MPVLRIFSFDFRYKELDAEELIWKYFEDKNKMHQQKLYDRCKKQQLYDNEGWKFCFRFLGTKKKA